MSGRIAFNGREYDGIEAMPEDVRRQYQTILDGLGEADRSKLESALAGGTEVKIHTTVRRRFRVNGKDYDSLEAMPPEIRRAYEQAVAGGAVKVSAGPASGAMPVLPPAIDAADSRTAARLRLALIVAIGVIVLVWLLLRHR